MRVELVWIAAGVILLILEILIPAFVCICFAAAAFIVGILGFTGILPSLESQILTFALLSPVFVFASRRILRHREKDPGVATNADELLGKAAVVVEEIDPGGHGRISLYGIDWRARSSNTDVIPLNARVTVVSIDGTTLIVSPDF